MKFDPSLLTFDTDFPLQESDHLARIPAGLTTKTELCAAIQQLTVPRYFTTGNWDQLFEVLRFPNLELPPGASRSGRTILLHQDVPLLKQDRREARTYLEIVIESILHLQQHAKEQAQAGADGPTEQLFAVFPPQTFAEISALLSEPVPWEVSAGLCIEYGMYPAASVRAPEWGVIQQWIEQLDGFAVECLDLEKKRSGQLFVTYVPRLQGYYLTYYSLSEEEPSPIRVSPPLEQGRLTRVLSQAEVFQIVHYMYVHEQLPQTAQWGSLSGQKARELDEQELILHYTNEEELFVEWPYETMQWMILEGMKELFQQENRLLRVQDWRTLLMRREAEMTRAQRFAAWCVLSRVDLNEISDRLLRLLESPDVQDRWLSARLLGGAHDERALPGLISMLTENWEVHRQTNDESWYFFEWRSYAPKLLRAWQTQEVLDALYHALVLWQEEVVPLYYEIDYRMAYEARLCYELGYRDAFDLVLALPLEAPHQKFLLISMARGYFMRSHHVSLQDESLNPIYYSSSRARDTEIAQILESKCHLSREQAQALLDEYHSDYRSF